MPYSTIKELVIDAYVSQGGMPDYESLTAKVLEHFPTSRWQRTHYIWYRSQFHTGRIDIVPTATAVGELNQVEDEIAGSIEFGVSLERDLHKYLEHHLDRIEPGLRLVANGIEHSVEAGRIDILATDKDDRLVVIELKAGTAGDAALGQLLGYMGFMATENQPNRQVRGILVAFDFEPRVIFAVKDLPKVSLCKYALSFSFEHVT